MFIMYTSASGQNVTISPRLGKGNFEPEYNPEARIELLSGSGISDGKMVANIKCSSCRSWQGGSMDFTGDSGRWIYAYKTGSSIASDDLSEDIPQHNDAESFTWDMTSAKGGDRDINPFVVTRTPPSSITTSSTTPSTTSSIATIHAILATLTFIALLPLGGILIRITSIPHLIQIHAACQSLGLILYTIALGMGIWLARTTDVLATKHPIIGIILFFALLSQPLTGLLHHRRFRQFGVRTAPSFAHITVGRVAIVLGMVNGGFGLQLVDASQSAKIAYAVVSAIVALVYIVCVVLGERKRHDRMTTHQDDDDHQLDGYSKSNQ
jgi:hypothetical protein